MYYVRLKKGVCLLLACTLFLTFLPFDAVAALAEAAENTEDHKAPLLQTLNDRYGADAETYYNLLCKNNHLDENGHTTQAKTFRVDGTERTQEALFADPATDLSQIVDVEGTSMSLKDLQTMIAIEKYLAYIEASQFNDGTWTDAQTANFDALSKQIAAEGLELSLPQNAASDASLTDASLSASGEEALALSSLPSRDHDAVMTVDIPATLLSAQTSSDITC